MPGASGVVSPCTRLTGSWPSRPMPWPVRCESAGQFVARAVAPLHVLRAHGVVDAARGHADARGFDRDLLAVAHLLPHLALLGRGLAEHEGARDVGLIALDRAAAVHEHHFAVAHRLRLSGAVWIGAGFAQQDQREFGRGAERRVRRVHHRADVFRRHAAPRCAARCADRRRW